VTDLLDLMRGPKIKRPVNDALGVVLGEVDEVLRLPHPRLAWDRARIELHRHTDGLWMWGTSWHADMAGCSYKVGPKWGNFAETRDDALHFAVDEVLSRMGDTESKDANHIRAWALELR
jgi:hypothetical protein